MTMRSLRWQYLAISVFFSVALVLCGSAARAQAPTFGVEMNFFGGQLYTSFFPKSDAAGAVGPNDVIEFSDNRFAIYSKTDGSLKSPYPGAPADQMPAMDFWAGIGLPAVQSTFNPRVLWDPSAQRWYITSTENPNAPNRYLFAVSKSADPTQGWNAFGIDADANNTRWMDFPRMGFDQGSVYLVGFDKNLPGGTGSPEQTVVVLPKSDLLLTTPTVSRATKFEGLPIYDLTNPTLPSFATPVADYQNTGMPMQLLSNNLPDQGKLIVQSVTGTPLAPQISGSGVNVTVTPYAIPVNSPAPGPNGTTTMIRTQAPRFAATPVQVNGSIWATQYVNNGGRDAIRWFELDATTNALRQEGLISSTSLSYYYPSIAVNSNNDVVISFLGSNAANTISSYAVLGHTTNHSTTWSAPQMLQQGDGTITLTSAVDQLWGDYGSTMVDPSNPNIFWTFNQISKDNGNWGVQISKLNIAPVTPPTSTMVVASLDGSRVNAFNGTTAVADALNASNGLVSPSSTIFDSSGRMYVADVGDNRIIRVEANGNMSTYADFGDNAVAVLGMAIKPSNGHLFATNMYNKSIVDITSTPGLGTSGTTFADPSDGLVLPWDLAFDSSNNLFVADALARKIFKFDSAGNATVFADQNDNLITPTGLAIDAVGNVFVSDLFRNKIYRFTPSGVGSVFADSADGMLTPIELQFGPDGKLYVADYLANKILSFDAAGVSTVVADGADGVSGPFDISFRSLPGFSAVAQVPEPASWVLAALGLLALAARQRHYKHRKMSRRA